MPLKLQIVTKKVILSYCLKFIIVRTSSTLKNPKWLLFTGCFILGQAVEGFSLSLASQSAIASVSNLTLIWNVIFSYYFFNEKFNFYPKSHHIVRNIEHENYGTLNAPLVSTGYIEYSFTEVIKSWDLLNYTVLLVGSCLTVVTAPTTDYTDNNPTSLLNNWLRYPFCLYTLLVVFTIAGLSSFLRREWKINSKRKHKFYKLNATLVAALASLLSSLTLTLTKMFVTLLQELIHKDEIRKTVRSTSVLTILFYVLLLVVWLGLVVSSMYALNLGLSRYEQRKIVPLYEIIGTVITITSGILFNQSYSEFTTSTFVVFILGILLMCFGIFLVSFREEKERETNSNESKTSLLSTSTT